MGGRLEGKAAVVTGGASGFGAGIATAFAREGAKVLIADLNEPGAEAQAAAIAANGGTASARQVDVTDRASVEAMVAACEARYGAAEILVANAGLGQRPTPLAEVSDEEFERQFAVNVRGVFNCCRAVLPAFRRQGRGNIVVTASGIALRPRPNLLVYGATKGAVLNFTKGLAEELAPEGFRVNALCPAVGDTPMLAEFLGGAETMSVADSEVARERFRSALPLGRLITPDDMGHAAVFLASDVEAATLTGCALPVDSGRCI